MQILRQRLAVLLLVVAFAGMLFFALSFVQRNVLSNRFEELEQERGARSIQQVLKAVDADIKQLAISTHDYAAWDDAYVFAKDHDQKFVASNFAVETLHNMNVDFVWVLDASDRELVALQPARDQKSGMPPAAAPEVISAMRNELPFMERKDTDPTPHYIVQTPGGLMVLVAHSILATGGRGESRGLLIFGRFLDSEVEQRAQETSQLPVTFYISDDAQASLPAEARALWGARRVADNWALVPVSDNEMHGFAAIRDVHGSPAVIVGTRIDRSLTEFGRQTERSLRLLFAAVFAVFGLFVAAFLLHMQRAARARLASERRYRAVITQAQETMLLVDLQTRQVLEANPAATHTLGFTAAELMAMQVDDLFYACDGDVLKSARPEIHAAANPDRILIVRCRDRRFIDVEVTASPLVVDEKDVISFVLRDVSARRRAERQLVNHQERLTFLAHHDALTGLLNRLGLERRLPEVIASAARDGRRLAFLYFDLDHFKKINDLRGHPFGDRLLQLAALRLQQSLATDDLIVRMGGDEFVVVGTNLHDASGAEAIAVRIRERMAEPFEVDGEVIQITSSVGVSVYPDDGADYEVLLKNADIALYESKDAGRDRYTLFNVSMVERVSLRLATEQDLRVAIRNGQFFVEYQPLFDLNTQRLVSFEALVRWHHPVRGRVPPVQFIEIAEKAGLIADIGNFVVREVCRQIGEWQRAGAAVVPVAVNVSTRQFEQRSVIDLVCRSTDSALIDPSLLHIELTESAFMEDRDRNVAILQELREMGVEVSVDDFGTGYSSLAYLRDLPIDCLKIDRSFVSTLGTPQGDAIVEAIIRMAHGRGVATVAEGVESPAQARRLRELGATYGQGFYYSRPVAPDVCATLLPAAEVTRRLGRTA